MGDCYQLSPGQATHGLFFNIICPFFMLISSKRASFNLVSQTASANHLEQTQLPVMNKSILPPWTGDSFFLSELLQKQDFWSRFMDGLSFFSGSGIHTELLLHHNKLCSQSNSLSSSYPEQNRIFWLLLPPLNASNSKMVKKAQVWLEINGWQLLRTTSNKHQPGSPYRSSGANS